MSLALTPFDGPWADGQDLVGVGTWGASRAGAGRLDPALVIEAYRRGVFPWYEPGGPVLWWSPDPRAVLDLDGLRVPRRLRRTMRARALHVDVEEDFEGVMRACGDGRPEGTWIHAEMLRCYQALHRAGHAHALGVRRGARLVGGIYGVSVGGLFAAESMFHRERDASKVALVHLVGRLVDRGFSLLDVQFLTPHLARLGAVEIPRGAYLARLRACRDDPVRFA